MSRAGYNDDCDDILALGRWRGAVASSIRGARGQAFLRELLKTLDAMPEKKLVTEELQVDGAFCTLGAIGVAHGLALDKIDTYDYAQLSREFGVAEPLLREIMWENDERIDNQNWVDVEFCGPVRPYYPEYGRHTRPVRVDITNADHQRWEYMRAWVAKHIKAPKAAT